MHHQNINRAAAFAVACMLGVISMPLPVFADPGSPYFSESIFEQQLRDQRAAQPGGAFNNAKVNVPSYISTATTSALGAPDPALDAVTAKQGVLPGGAVPGLGAAGSATQAAIAAQGAVLGAAGGAGGASGGGGFSPVTATNAATGAALGILKAIP